MLTPLSAFPRATRLQFRWLWLVLAVNPQVICSQEIIQRSASPDTLTPAFSFIIGICCFASSSLSAARPVSSRIQPMQFGSSSCLKTYGPWSSPQQSADLVSGKPPGKSASVSAASNPRIPAVARPLKTSCRHSPWSLILTQSAIQSSPAYWAEQRQRPADTLPP